MENSHVFSEDRKVYVPLDEAADDVVLKVLLWTARRRTLEEWRWCMNDNEPG